MSSDDSTPAAGSGETKGQGRDVPPPAKPSAFAAFGAHLRNPRIVVPALVCLLVGVAVGWELSAWLGVSTSRAYRLPSFGELDEVCATKPGVKLREWQYIVLHHSAGDIGNAAAIDSFHRSQGWRNGLGYDFVIGNGSRSGNGEIEVSERWRQQMDGAHCKADRMNQKGIGICFVGNFEEHPPSEEQIHAGLALVRRLAAQFSIPPEDILGHRDVEGAETKCPGRLFPLALFRAAASSP